MLSLMIIPVKTKSHNIVKKKMSDTEEPTPEYEYDGSEELTEEDRTPLNDDGYFYPTEKQMKRYNWLLETKLEIHPDLTEFIAQLLCMEEVMIENGMTPTTEEVKKVAENYYKSSVYEGITIQEEPIPVA